jgi:two-component system, OmpR family, response regulator ChvI
MTLVRLLVVDDEPDVADVLKTGLEMRGFAVDVFYDPIKALASFRPDTYDLVISDIKMPNMNGFEMVYEIKKIDNSVPVIFLTGFVDLVREVNKLFTRLNVREVIQKPIGIQQLVDKINNLNIGPKPRVEG